MKKVLTKDGSSTFFSEKYKECFHSMSGALEEAFEKFVKPCNLKLNDNILDICFGLGYNSLAAIHSVKKLNITALEKDKTVLESIPSLEVPDILKKDFEVIKKVAKDFHYNDQNVKINLILGDAIKTIKDIDKKFDAVFHDPFSRPKNPELWTVDFFKNVRKLMKKNAILATYSYAKVVRENLSEAGFSVRDGPIVGRRSPSTLAVNL